MTFFDFQMLVASVTEAIVIATATVMLFSYLDRVPCCPYCESEESEESEEVNKEC